MISKIRRPHNVTKSSKQKASQPRVVCIEAGHSHPDVDSIPIARMTAMQLHRYAAYYNWDGGNGPMVRVIRHPKCDLGTALLVFWLSDPCYYFEALSKGDKDALRFAEGKQLIREIIAKVRRGHFKTARISFNPRKYRGSDWTSGDHPPEAIGIPDFMCEPVRAGRSDHRVPRRRTRK
jgi:hypothetical protein